MKQKAVIFDLDGTLFDCDHRIHHIQSKKRNYRKFYEEIKNDTVIMPVMAIADSLFYNSYIKVLFLTGREGLDYVVQLTQDQLNRHFEGVTLDEDLFMRAEKDYRQDYVVKEEIYKEVIAPNYEIITVFEDRQQVIDMWRRNNIFVFDVKQTPSNY